MFLSYDCILAVIILDAWDMLARWLMAMLFVYDMIDKSVEGSELGKHLWYQFN